MNRKERFMQLVHEMEEVAKERDAEIQLHNQLGIYTDEEMAQKQQEFCDTFAPRLIGFINEGKIDMVMNTAVILLGILNMKDK